MESNGAWIATGLFVVVYGLLISEKLNRAVLALLGATVLILAGVMTQEAALHGVDFNTLGLLLGMMLIVGIAGKSGMFQYVAIWAAKKVKGEPLGVLMMLSVVTAVLSALLDNVTTVLLVAPVTLLITEELRVKPYPYLVFEIFFSNVGGTATLIGDPPNIMIGSSVGLTFNQFVVNLGPVVLVTMVVTLAPAYWIWRKELVASDERRARVMGFDEREAIQDWRLLWQSLAVLGLVLTGFVLARQLHLEPATIAMVGAGLLLFLDNAWRPVEKQAENVQRAFGEMEWVTLFFFLGLFILVHGLEVTGVIGMMAKGLLAATGGDREMTVLAILWGSAVLSAFVDNIPFVATMIPMVKEMGPAFGGEAGLEPFWWSLSLGACYGGNGTLIGASANLVVAGFAERAGHPIRFGAYLRSCFGLMLLSVAVAHAYLWLRYL